jgi:hypothetical protein
VCFTLGPVTVCLLALVGDALTFWTAVYAVAALGTLGVLAAAARMALRQIDESVQSRHAATLAELSRRWDEPLLAESMKVGSVYSSERLGPHVRELEDQGEFDKLTLLLRVPNFLEDLAILNEEGAISTEMIRKSLGGVVVATWDHWKPATLEMRGEQNYDLVYEHFERLAERLRALLEEERRHAEARR